MSLFDPLQLAKDTSGVWMPTHMPIAINGFAFDSRKIKEGNLFLALKTDSGDGHDYLLSAKSKGASGAIVEKVDSSINWPQLQVGNVLQAFQQLARIHRERFLGLVIGITGSCGKTSTKDLLHHLLGHETHATFLNHNNLLGVPITLMGLDNTLHNSAVIEAGMNISGEMECLASMIKPNISIITNIFPVHLEGVGSVEEIAKEKAFLAQATKDNGIILFPNNCLNYQIFRSLGLKEKNVKVLAKVGEAVNHLPEDQVIRYELNETLESTVSLSIQVNKTQIHTFLLPLLSEGMVTNVALAVSVTLLIGIEPDIIQNRLSTWVPSKHRGQVYQYGKQTYYADCYNANPASLLDALELFQKRFTSSSKHLYILGCMAELSDQAHAYHYQVGKSLKLRPQDKILLLGAHAQSYALGLKEAGNHFSQIICLQSKEKAFDYLKDFEGTVFLKGSKPYALWELLPEQAQLQETRKIVITC